ncbi:hypothetical protein PPERSA_06044 [Pseudocohnilembus persalinus]|uniref:VPS9 domain-containing protein n=1 Tax=Pseudocohnilembus persalinus TaxID=266149 RepID=A0A0V0QQF8_PSEPJ|nr:hypothetical protein PPERSA_06044 [Pseudocohnilembus persalinus]|eukprot:KRX04491.1 hypothetical protein PPERSA_06044 [Pseudocohnilembus persalinus]
MGGENSKQKYKKKNSEEMREIKKYLQYCGGYRMNKMLEVQKKAKQDYINEEPDSGFGCFSSQSSKSKSAKKNKDKKQKYKLKWADILLQFCDQNDECYTWAQTFRKFINNNLSNKKINLFLQKQDQEKLIWSLDIQNVQQIQEQQEDEDDILEDQKFHQSFHNLANHIPSYVKGQNYKIKEQENKITSPNQFQVNDVLRHTELFFEDILDKKERDEFAQSFVQINNNYSTINQEDDLDEIKFSEFQKSQNNKNKIKITRQNSNAQPTNNKNKKVQDNASSKNSSGKPDSSSGQQVTKLYYQNDIVILNSQQNKQQNQKDQSRLVKTVAFYKKAIDFIEQQFQNQKSVFNYFIKEFRKQFFAYYQEQLEELKNIQKVEDKNIQSLILSKVHQSQIVKKNGKAFQNSVIMNQQNKTATRMFDSFSTENNNNNQNNNNEDNNSQLKVQNCDDKNYNSQIKSVKEQIKSEVTMIQQDDIMEQFKENYELAVEEIKDFVKIMSQVLVYYYDLIGLQNHRYGRLLQEENFQNFMISYIFDDQIQNLLLQFQLQINYKEEMQYKEKLLEFQKVTPDLLGIRKELQEISLKYNRELSKNDLLSENLEKISQQQKFKKTNTQFQNTFATRGKSHSQDNIVVENQKFMAKEEENENQRKKLRNSDIQNSTIQNINGDQKIVDMGNSNQSKISQKTGFENLQSIKFVEEEQEVYDKIIKLFSNIDKIPSPVHKLKLLIRCNELILDEIEKVNENLKNQTQIGKKKKEITLDGDDVINAYIYIIGKSGVENLISHQNLIKDFMNESQAQSQSGYYFTVTYSATQFILNFDSEKLIKPQNNNDVQNQNQQFQEDQKQNELNPSNLPKQIQNIKKNISAIQEEDVSQVENQ